jgi:hypothetical protein
LPYFDGKRIARKKEELVIFSIILSIVILGIIVFIHELGHFLTAKFYKMPVFEFAIGMGPKLFSKKINGTVYSVRMLPLGGFVNIGGMQPEEFDMEEFRKEKIDEITRDLKEDLEIAEIEISDDEFVERAERRLNIEMEEELERQVAISENGFYKKPAFSRFVVLIAGIAMNFISAILVIFLIFSITGTVPSKHTKPVINVVQNDSKVKNILQPNDEIVELNGRKISEWGELSEEIQKINGKKYANQDIDVKVFRNGKMIDNKVKLTYYKDLKTYVLGIQVKMKKSTFSERVKYSFVVFGDYFVMMLKGVKMLITGKVPFKEMTGPVGLPKLIGAAYNSGGMLSLLNIFIILSINIGLMNLLPIPALDGGRILFVLPEFVGIKVNKKIEERIHMVGMILLMILMALMMFSDITKYF